MTPTPEPTITPQPSPTPYVSNLSDVWATPTARPSIPDQMALDIADSISSIDIEEEFISFTDNMIQNYNSIREPMDIVIMFYIAAMLLVMLKTITNRISEL